VSEAADTAPEIAPSAVVFDGVRLGANVRIMPGAVLGRPPVRAGAVTREPPEEAGETSIGDRTVIGCNAVVYAGVRIGADSLIGDNACIREGCTVGDRTIVAMGVTVNYDTSIGSRVKIMDNSHITGNAVIEDDVFVSALVSTTNDNAMGRRAGSTDRWTGRGPTIRRFATIGQGACLLPGVEIGPDAVVGAGAVVTKDVPSATVVMGVPARVVRELRPDERRS
jgi:acetyltransferase-like isoleucine patch superfamily enzyme